MCHQHAWRSRLMHLRFQEQILGTQNSHFNLTKQTSIFYAIVSLYVQNSTAYHYHVFIFYYDLIAIAKPPKGTNSSILTTPYMFKIGARWRWGKFSEKKFARSSTEVIWMQHLIHLDTCGKVSILLKILHATQTRLTHEWVKRYRKSSKVREWGKLNSSAINVSVWHLWLVVKLMNRRVIQAKLFQLLTGSM